MIGEALRNDCRMPHSLQNRAKSARFAAIWKTDRDSVVLSKKYDQDIIEHLEPMESKSGYIKELIQADMQKAGK